MDLGITLSIPRHTATVPMARKIVDAALVEWGVNAEARGDISIALSEACANAVQHSGTQADYQVDAELQSDRCVLEVIDFGSGFPPQIWPAADDHDAFTPFSDEHGRGLQLIRALMDRMDIVATAGRGVTVHFEKILKPADDCLPLTLACNG
ncbi:ATP-binding protein [Nonomuraea ceibae]|uniref:ATP-binding protein n=1 Tax=Nonomuraea ceibae TaxID=1935170 RepID=UPI001C5D0E60|nr:ATP-binding protein [Nonomuraea ceibae]